VPVVLPPRSPSHDLCGFGRAAARTKRLNPAGRRVNLQFGSTQPENSNDTWPAGRWDSSQRVKHPARVRPAPARFREIPTSEHICPHCFLMGTHPPPLATPPPARILGATARPHLFQDLLGGNRLLAQCAANVPVLNDDGRTLAGAPLHFDYGDFLAFFTPLSRHPGGPHTPPPPWLLASPSRETRAARNSVITSSEAKSVTTAKGHGETLARFTPLPQIPPRPGVYSEQPITG